MFRVNCLEFSASGSGIRVQSLMFRASGLELPKSPVAHSYKGCTGSYRDKEDLGLRVIHTPNVPIIWVTRLSRCGF